MTESLLLRLPRGPGEPASWLVADEGGRLVVPVRSGALEDAAALGAGRRIVGLAPAGDVLLADVELPAKTSASRLQQVVPFALEEQLADDIDELHFALGRRASAAATPTPVAAVGKPVLNEWLAALAAAGLSPAVLWAESSLLPTNPGQFVMLVEDEQLLVAAPGRTPIALPAGDFSSLLALLPAPESAATGEAAAPAPGLLVYASATDWEAHAAGIEALGSHFAAVRVQLLTEGPLPLFAQQLPAVHAINLLQGAFAPAIDRTTGWRPWRAAAALLVALFGLHVAGRAWELSRLTRAERELDAAIGQVFRTAMPGDTAQIGDMRRRMEQRLLAVRHAGARGTLLPALSAVAQARGATGDARLETLSYSGGALDLKVSAPDAASVDRLNQHLRAAGWRSELTAGNAAPNGYVGRIQIRAAGS